MNVASLFLHNMKQSQDAWFFIGLTDKETEILEKTFGKFMTFNQTGGFNYWVVERLTSKLCVRRFTWDNFEYFNNVEEIVSFIQSYYNR